MNSIGSFSCNCSVPSFGEGFELGNDSVSCIGKLVAHRNTDWSYLSLDGKIKFFFFF